MEAIGDIRGTVTEDFEGEVKIGGQGRLNFRYADDTARKSYWTCREEQNRPVYY